MLRENGGKPKRSAKTGIKIILADELARFGKLDNFARVSGIRIDRVSVGGDQVSIGREHQPERTIRCGSLNTTLPLLTGATALPAPDTAKIALSAVEAT